MRQAVKDFVSIVAGSFEIKEPIYEFGSLQVSSDASADLRPLFPGLQYVGADIRGGVGVDRILDVHDIDLPSESAGTVLCVKS